VLPRSRASFPVLPWRLDLRGGTVFGRCHPIIHSLLHLLPPILHVLPPILHRHHQKSYHQFHQLHNWIIRAAERKHHLAWVSLAGFEGQERCSASRQKHTRFTGHLGQPQSFAE
jgi:hypothetical protein